MSADTPVIDLGYRPQSYFWPITHDIHVIAAIKGERRRKAIRNAFDADRVSPLDELFATPTLPDEHRLALGRLHRGGDRAHQHRLHHERCDERLCQARQGPHLLPGRR
jgi:hypothetical protein